MRVGGLAGWVVQGYQCQLKNWHKRLDFDPRACNDTIMKTKTYTLVQTLPQGGTAVIWRFSKKADAVDAAKAANDELRQNNIPPQLSRCYVE
jgi:hypothetical protein